MINKFKFVWLLQPLLIATFPILYILSRNPLEGSLLHTFFAIIIITIGTSILFLCCSFIHKSFFKGIVLTNLIILLFYSLTPIINHVLIPISKNSRTILFFNIKIFRVRYTLFIITIISLFLLFYLSKKLTGTFFLRLFILPICGILALSLIRYIPAKIKLIKSQKQWVQQNQSFRNELIKQLSSLPQPSSYPDIYFIILDAYPSKDHLLKTSNFNNEKFLTELRKRGFYIASESLSNYQQTLQSLPCTLNMNYLPHNMKSIPYLYLWDNNNVVFFLKKLGYRYIDLSLKINHGSINYKEQFGLQEKSFFIYLKNEFHSFFSSFFQLGRTYVENWTPLYGFFYKLYFKALRNCINNKLQLLNMVPKLKSPKFIYTHFFIPHPPHVFDRNGNSLPEDETLSDLERNIRGHVESIRYINKKILESIDIILQQSTIPPIIILQGDHGIDYIVNNSRHRFQILNAWFLPKEGTRLLYQTISPVNNFRVVFNHYFGTKLPLLKDLSFCGPFKNDTFVQYPSSKKDCP